MKLIYITFFLIIAIVVYWFLPFGERVGGSKIIINENVWEVGLAQSPNQRAKGLSGRESLESGTGLLFVFQEEGFHGIWMKDMRFPIDIIWLNKELEVVGLKENVTPESFPESFKPKAKSNFVLEVNAGDIKRAQIKLKDMARIF